MAGAVSRLHLYVIMGCTGTTLYFCNFHFVMSLHICVRVYQHIFMKTCFTLKELLDVLGADNILPKE
jgi:hypothetical protein